MRWKIWPRYGYRLVDKVASICQETTENRPNSREKRQAEQPLVAQRVWHGKMQVVLERTSQREVEYTKHALIIVVTLSALLFSFAPTYADTFSFNGYTITMTPDDQTHPFEKGLITIAGSSDNASVDLSGRYYETDTVRHYLVFEIKGTVTTPEAAYHVQRRFVFSPTQRRFVWRVIITWVESLTRA